MTIWALFSIANDYAQPDNNLEAWWCSKPNFQQVAKAVGIIVNLEKGNSSIGKLLRGREVYVNYTNYRLKELKEGILRR